MKSFYMYFSLIAISIASVCCLNCSNNKQIYATPNWIVADSIIADTNKVYVFVEQMPIYPGGESEMSNFLANKMKYPVIPDEKLMDNLHSSVRFTVTKRGEIKNIHPTDKKYEGTILTDSLISTIKKMPLWIPGKQNGKEVDVYFTLRMHVSPRR